MLQSSPSCLVVEKLMGCPRSQVSGDLGQCVQRHQGGLCSTSLGIFLQREPATSFLQDLTLPEDLLLSHLWRQVPRGRCCSAGWF